MEASIKEVNSFIWSLCPVLQDSHGIERTKFMHRFPIREKNGSFGGIGISKQSGWVGRGQHWMPPVRSCVTGERDISWSRNCPNCMSIWEKLALTSSWGWIVSDSMRGFGSGWPERALRGAETPNLDFIILSWSK